MKYKTELDIEGKKIGLNHPTYFIADIAANHDGDLGRAKELIWKAKESGADAAKFQHFQANSIVSDYGFKNLGDQQSHQAKWNKSVFDVYKDASVSLDWTEELKSTCDEADITFFTSPYAFDLVDAVNKFVPAYKIGSGDISWIEMIQYIAKKQKPYIIATGASTTDEVVRAVNAGLSINRNMALLQCNTNYTGSLENMKYIQLNVLNTYKSMFPGMVLGLSDHTPGHATVLGAIALGGRIVEKHFTDDVSRDGPDHAFSLDPSSWSEMVERSRELEAALGDGIKKVEENERETVVLQRRALRLKKDMPKGHCLTKQDIEILRPCPIDALPPFELDSCIGKSLQRPIAKGEYLRSGDIESEK